MIPILTLQGREITIKSNEKTRVLSINGHQAMIVEIIRDEFLVRLNQVVPGQLMEHRLIKEDLEIKPIKGRIFNMIGSNKSLVISKIILADPIARPANLRQWKMRYRCEVAHSAELLDAINGNELTNLMDKEGKWALDCPEPTAGIPVIFNETISEVHESSQV